MSAKHSVELDGRTITVTHERNMAPKTPTYDVDDPNDTEYTYTVVLLDGKATCVQHGETCDHAKAVQVAVDR